MMEAAWRCRFRAPVVSLPQWARERPDRSVYLSNADGKYEWYAWDRESGTRGQLTDRPTGTSVAGLDPAGEFLWWFDDASGNEFGQWVRRSFDGARQERVPDGPGYVTGLSLGQTVTLASWGRDGRFFVDAIRGGVIETIYQSDQAVSVGGLSRDERLVVIAHSEHGDSRNRALRVVTVDGSSVADLSDGPGRGLSPSGWPVTGGY
jgi:hypothetical protein